MGILDNINLKFSHYHPSPPSSYNEGIMRVVVARNIRQNLKFSCVQYLSPLRVVVGGYIGQNLILSFVQYFPPPPHMILGVGENIGQKSTLCFV